ncbi:MAG: protein translocase subunit SecD [Chloroflexota bacterium]
MKPIIGKLLIVALPLVAVITLLYPTYRAYNLEGIRAEYIARAQKAHNPQDSLQVMDEFSNRYGESLKSAKNSQLKLGLDLRGGMYVTMEVDVIRLIEESAINDAVDETFNEVIKATRQEASTTDESVIDIFQAKFNQIARPKGKTLLNYFETGDMRDLSEEKIIEMLDKNSRDAIDQAQEVIRQRIDQYGLTEPNIQKQGARRILLELPGVSNQAEMRQLLETTARLEFKLVRNNADIVRAFAKMDKFLSNELKRRKGIAVDTATTALAPDTAAQKNVATAKNEKGAAVKKDSTKAKADSAKVAADSGAKKGGKANPYEGLPKEEAQRRYAMDHPFTSLFATYFVPGRQQRIQQVDYVYDQYPDGDYMFRIAKDSIAKFRAILARPEIRSLIPIDLEVSIDAKPDQQIFKQSNVEIFDFYSLKKESELTGEVITDARASFDQTTNQPMVLMSMNTDGAERWARITGANINKRIAIVLDERVYSAPNVQTKITGGGSQITGMANAEEARLLEIVLKAGALKAPVQIIEERVVGPSLGEDSISKGLNASWVSIVVVFLFMFLYYRTGGHIANFAVLMNVLLVVAVMAALGGTLTLPGIAGLILTLGMSVDCNVLIYERIREEISRGRSLRSSVDEGFSKAMSAILDSNITTFITGVILYYLGSGPIQGFALTLMLGILGSLFTGVIVSKAIFEIFIARGATAVNLGQKKVVPSTSVVK